MKVWELHWGSEALRSSASINMQSRYIATTHCDDTRWAGTVIPVDLQLVAAGLSHAKQLHTYNPSMMPFTCISAPLQLHPSPPLTARHNEATLLPCVRGWWNTKREEELCTGFSVWQGSDRVECPKLILISHIQCSTSCDYWRCSSKKVPPSTKSGVNGLVRQLIYKKKLNNYQAIWRVLNLTVHFIICLHLLSPPVSYRPPPLLSHWPTSSRQL